MNTDRTKMAYFLTKIKRLYKQIESPYEEDIEQLFNSILTK